MFDGRSYPQIMWLDISKEQDVFGVRYSEVCIYINHT